MAEEHNDRTKYLSMEKMIRKIKDEIKDPSILITLGMNMDNVYALHGSAVNENRQEWLIHFVSPFVAGYVKDCLTDSILSVEPDMYFWEEVAVLYEDYYQEIRDSPLMYSDNGGYDILLFGSYWFVYGNDLDASQRILKAIVSIKESKTVYERLSEDRDLNVEMFLNAMTDLLSVDRGRYVREIIKHITRHNRRMH